MFILSKQKFTAIKAQNFDSKYLNNSIDVNNSSTNKDMHISCKLEYSCLTYTCIRWEDL